jgi:hypothetical protein
MSKAKAASGVDFSDLFQRVKHKNHRVTAKERDRVIRFLDQPASIFTAEAGTAIYVLCLSSEPTPENVALVERFLADQADDSAKADAISCLFTIWGLSEEWHVSYVLEALARILDKERYLSSMAAISSALHMMHAKDRHDLSFALSSVFDALHREAVRENEFAMDTFISACLTLANAKARKGGQRPTYFHTIDEALEVYRNKEAYLLRPLH